MSRTRTEDRVLVTEEQDLELHHALYLPQLRKWAAYSRRWARRTWAMPMPDEDRSRLRDRLVKMFRLELWAEGHRYELKDKT
jgi:hypothetical protein